MKPFVKTLLIIIGLISLALGVFGIIVPLLPTTPFLLLSAACYIKSSEKLYQWLITHKVLGLYIQSFRSGKAIPIKVKLMAIGTVWLSFGFSAIFVVDHIWLKAFFIFGALFWTVIVLSVKSFRKPSNHENTNQPG
ncbi:YbaN family protein [Ureibacillus thermosphaericus]|uniref:YbaN family protein n=1 Tax=Ureibacillus thermosphaericus TaxID=51173 RepID=UPI000BBC656E|nr:YbaN family protein [Ureibacillus thermosphaericus]